ncbi:DUF952 domain-containing protein [Chamaesiphon sp. VAR_48_metabat_135_sub]|uniref:DUF952 domain-containing protein n=1 Tax=Chamaesiphon sp. VAR_48_metabat_135_sub TaxID=2964699 RepID=UPI00286B1FCB|nr:DUF952 domain-containing protein [Chamaesiphon sp. VAR_48_metabat_135_sub]
MTQHLATTHRSPDPISVLICQHRTCRKQGSAEVLTAFRSLTIPNITYEGCGCLGNCGNGPMVLILPTRIWYYLVQPQDVSIIAVVLRKFMNTILHITQKQEWEKAQDLGTYRSSTLASEGFIHCSTLAQVIGSANRFFKGQKDLVILKIDIDRVNPEIRYEGGDANNLFPHIYGELNIDAVIASIDLEADVDGLFILPKELIG